MSLDAAQTKVTELEDDVARAATEQANPKPVTMVHPDLLNFWISRPALPPAHVTEQAFQSFRRVVEANCTVMRVLCDMAQRQQDLVLATAEATLAGLPGAIARQVDSALASVETAYGQNLRMLGTWTSTMLERPSQTDATAQHPAAS